MEKMLKIEIQKRGGGYLRVLVSELPWYKRHMMLEICSLYLWEPQILTICVHSSKIKLKDIDFYTVCDWNFSFKLPYFVKKLVFHTSLKKSARIVLLLDFTAASIIHFDRVETISSICKCSKRLFVHSYTVYMLLRFTKIVLEVSYVSNL